MRKVRVDDYQHRSLTGPLPRSPISGVKKVLMIKVKNGGSVVQ